MKIVNDDNISNDFTVRVWFGHTGKTAFYSQFGVDDPPFIPKVGEFVDSDHCGGWVTHVQYFFANDRAVIHITLSDNRSDG